MFNSKEQPKKVAASGDFVANASEVLEEAVAEEIEVEDPTSEQAAAIIEELTEEVAEEKAPIRHRGPRT